MLVQDHLLISLLPIITLLSKVVLGKAINLLLEYDRVVAACDKEDGRGVFARHAGQINSFRPTALISRRIFFIISVVKLAPVALRKNLAKVL